MKPTDDEITLAIDAVRAMIPTDELPNRSDTRQFIARIANVVGISEDEFLLRFANHYQHNKEAMDNLFDDLYLL